MTGELRRLFDAMLAYMGSEIVRAHLEGQGKNYPGVSDADPEAVIDAEGYSAMRTDIIRNNIDAVYEIMQNERPGGENSTKN